MRVTISFKHMEHTESLDKRIHEKSKKLEKYFEGQTNVTWTCFAKQGKHGAEVRVTGPTFDYHANAMTENLYKSLDQAIVKLEKQLNKRKDKWRNHISRHNKGVGTMEIIEPEIAWADYDEDSFDDVS